MAESSPKQLALHAIESLSADASLEDAMERLHLLVRVGRGLADAEAGHTVPHEAVRERFAPSSQSRGPKFARWRRPIAAQLRGAQ
jgi:hypothetical protein